MIHVCDNECPICLKTGSWNLNYQKSQMEMFKCGHGTCKECYKLLRTQNILDNISFSCPLCRGDEQQHRTGFLTERTGSWTTFAEWYNEFEIYIKSGVAKNVVKNSTFGQQLLRLIRESKKGNCVKTKTL